VLSHMNRWRREVHESLQALSRVDAVLLVSLLALVFCVWAFVTVADAVTEQHTQRFDEQILRGLRDPGNPSRGIGPSWMPEAMRDLTSLGSAPVLVLFVLSVAGSLAVRRQFHALVLLIVATAGGELLNAALKGIFARPRPGVVPHLTEVRSLSFPSGHAMDSAVIYLTLAALLARLVTPLALKVYFLALAFFLTFVVGLSRVYLGVHYPSDVLAGWTAGLAWALLCWTVASHLQRRGTVEPPE
jgi:undecaprenyl-diphosphatase